MSLFKVFVQCGVVSGHPINKLLSMFWYTWFGGNRYLKMVNGGKTAACFPPMLCRLLHQMFRDLSNIPVVCNWCFRF